MDITNPIYSDPNKAREHLEALHWPNGPVCPHCGNCDGERITKLAGKSTRPGVHKCKECEKPFTVTVGTIFEDSKIPLNKWLLAFRLLNGGKKGFGAHELHRALGITYKSAWFMTQRLRQAAQTQSFNRPLDGEIEADETFVGGKEKNKHAWQRTGGKQGGVGKSAVLGILEREGELRTGLTPTLSARNVQSVVRENVEPGSLLLTDEHPSFRGLSRDYIHETVNHSAGEYVRKFYIHTNGIESVWALFKRQIVGTHHYLSPKHLNRYLGEMTWRFNRRAQGEGERVNSLLEQVSGRLTYKELIA